MRVQKERRHTLLIRSVRPLIRVLARASPKRRQAVIRESPDFGDTTYCMVKVLCDRDVPTTILVSGQAVAPAWVVESGVDVLPVHSLQGFLRYLVSGYVFFSHSLYFSPAPASNQTVVNLWHGNPFKRGGADLPAGVSMSPKFDYTIATSELTARILARTFRVPPEKVWTTGLPRNDVLARVSLPAQLLQQLPDKFVMWLPTYRFSASGAVRFDGDPETALPSEREVGKICDALADGGQSLMVKLHPMAPVEESDRFRSDPRVLVIDEDWLLTRNTTLYQILSASSGLISDYSSVAIDYLVTGNPVYLIMSDYEEYQNTRGLVYDQQTLSRLGHIRYTYEDLIESIAAETWISSSGHNMPIEFYSAPRDGASERVMELALSAND